MIPVNVSSEPTLVVSVGPRPANSRPANSTREYEPGSGDRHDPAPVHHPPPARSPPGCGVLALGVRRSLRGRPSSLKGAPASLTRPAYGRPLTPEPRRPLGQQPRGRPTPACPPRTRRTPRARTPRPPSGARGHQGLRSTQPPQKRGTNRTNHNKTLENKPRNPRVVDRPFHMNIHVSAEWLVGCWSVRLSGSV
jgi:hypothetical protein